MVKELTPCSEQAMFLPNFHLNIEPNTDEIARSSVDKEEWANKARRRTCKRKRFAQSHGARALGSGSRWRGTHGSAGGLLATSS